MPGLEAINHCGGVEDFSAAGVHQISALARPRHALRVNQVMRVRQKWQMHRNDMALRQQSIEFDIANAVVHRPLLPRKRVVCQHFTSEAAENLSCNPPDLAGSDYAHRL